MASYGSARIGERFYEDRAYLLLVYPEKAKGSKKSAYTDKKVKIPFYENPTLTETQTPRYATYKLLGRNSDLYSFLGSDSRQISLTFNFTLKHLQHFMRESPWQSKEYMFDKVEKFSVVRDGKKREILKEQNQFALPVGLGGSFDAGPPNQSSLVDYESTLYADRIVNAEINQAVDDYHNQDAIRAIDTIASYEAEHKELIAKELGVDIDKYRQNDGANTGFLADGLDYLNSLFAEEPQKNLMNVKAIVYYYVNLIRSTTLGSAELGLGPPIVRLNYGPMYQDVPCIVTKYDISIDNTAGFDKETLIPNRIKVNLSMNEIRVGNFTKHEPLMFGPADDNVATWESVFKFATVDPRTEARLSSQATKDEFVTQKITDTEQLKASNLDYGLDEI